MITPKLKDFILTHLTNSGVTIMYDLNDAEKYYNTDGEILELILDQFENKELIKIRKFMGGTGMITLTADAFDFISRGGFTAQEEFIQANIEKLITEIEVLKKELGPHHLNTIEKLANIAAGVSAGLGLFIRHS
jgi:hypothetical protein